MTMLPAPVLYFFFFLLTCGLILNLCGIYCCLKQKKKLPKQKIILLNLSASEVTVILYTLCHLGVSRVNIREPRELAIINKVMCTLYHGVTSLLYNSMLLISLDRFVCIAAQMFYRINVMESTLKKSIVIIWIVSFTIPTVVVAIVHDINKQIQIVLYHSYALQGFFIVISCIAYCLVAKSQRRRSILFEPTASRGKSNRNQKTFLVSFSLIATFVIFYIIPNYVQSKDTTVSSLMISLTYIGLIVDPILYTLLHQSLRYIARNMLTCSGNISQSYNIERQRTIVMTSSPMHQKQRLMAHPSASVASSLSTSPTSVGAPSSMVSPAFSTPLVSPTEDPLATICTSNPSVTRTESCSLDSCSLCQSQSHTKV